MLTRRYLRVRGYSAIVKLILRVPNHSFRGSEIQIEVGPLDYNSAIVKSILRVPNHSFRRSPNHSVMEVPKQSLGSVLRIQ